MTVQVENIAPMWAQRMARSVDNEIQQVMWPFISRQTYLVSELTAAMAALYPWGVVFVSNGAGNRPIAVSNGTAFYYADGTAV